MARFGQGFHLIDARDGSRQVFAAFGDIGRQRNRFAASEQGDVVLAPGTYGVVCWKRDGRGWKEAWAIDYWKTFKDLDWPVSNTAERIPQFQAVMPRGGDEALILFGETSDNGWITPDNPNAAWLAAVNLNDGKPRWQFDVPIPRTQLFPTLHTSPDGSRVLLHVQMGSWGKETFRFFTIERGKAMASWNARTEPLDVAIAAATGHVAAAFKGRFLELRRTDGTIVYNLLWPNQPVSLAFADDGRDLYVADDSGRLTRLDERGREVWRRELGRSASLAARGGRVFAACWDGRLRSLTENGHARWTLDLTPSLRDAHPLDAVVASAVLDAKDLHQVRRPATTSATAPDGENLLCSGKAMLTVGGTPGWMSEGKLQVTPADLTNGRRDDIRTPWLKLDELFWDAHSGRQVWAEVTFKAPTSVRALTVHENPDFPDAWPTESLVQVWAEALRALGDRRPRHLPGRTCKYI